MLWSTGSRHAGFSSCGSWALECRLTSCGALAQLLRSMWDLPEPGLEPVSPALAGGFLTTVPPGKPTNLVFKLLKQERMNHSFQCGIQPRTLQTLGTSCVALPSHVHSFASKVHSLCQGENVRRKSNLTTCHTKTTQTLCVLLLIEATRSDFLCLRVNSIWGLLLPSSTDWPPSIYLGPSRCSTNVESQKRNRWFSGISTNFLISPPPSLSSIQL